ncbi:Clp protease ClpP [Aestuariicella hydrocarbonica]|uniref:ATP-dependent Clp protease proteolytic subunit n=2 Tax=Pseudomaricurvus hydrocarbonicus TaxID=1470433 RepID=A0A9E5JTL7_9GAMM|nr:Clp protease ClpP [Aestuariicella hydrocarbonica]
MDLAPKAFEQWNPDIRAASTGTNDIGIYDVIGEDFWGEGVTAKRISAALRSIGSDQPVTVNINSPGGDLFEGLAIYNLLRQHQGEVTVRIVGIAASAASVIAMAGTRVEIARAGFLMIHNAWVCACGNQNDFREIADYLAPFDSSMADIYSARTGLPATEIAELMNAESYIGGTDAIADGFADDYLPADVITEAQARGGHIAARKMDIALAKAGVPRSERRKLAHDFKSSTQTAAGGGTHNATTPNTPSAVVHADPLPTIQFPL